MIQVAIVNKVNKNLLELHKQLAIIEEQDDDCCDENENENDDFSGSDVSEDYSDNEDEF